MSGALDHYLGHKLLVDKGPLQGLIATCVAVDNVEGKVKLQAHRESHAQWVNIAHIYDEVSGAVEPVSFQPNDPIYHPVNKPSHYAADRKYEPIDVIEDWFPSSTPGSYHKGNTLKYLSRAGRKGAVGKNSIECEIEDCEKAAWYLQRHIANLKAMLAKSAGIATQIST